MMTLLDRKDDNPENKKVFYTCLSEAHRVKYTMQYTVLLQNA